MKEGHVSQIQPMVFIYHLLHFCVTYLVSYVLIYFLESNILYILLIYICIYIQYTHAHTHTHTYIYIYIYIYIYSTILLFCAELECMLSSVVILMLQSYLMYFLFSTQIGLSCR
jgi:hypothetical protein